MSCPIPKHLCAYIVKIMTIIVYVLVTMFIDVTSWVIM